MEELNAIIIGAGIAGLCAGIGLAQQGRRVIILESAHELAPIGIGLHIPPNSTRVLQHYGLLEQMEKDAILPSIFHLRRWKDSSKIATFPASNPEQSGDLPYWSMRRSDYQSHLLEAAKKAGCEIRLSARVESLDTDAPSATLASGEVLNADIIVVADGVKSELRQQVIPEVDTSMAVSSMASYRGFVAQKDLESDPMTASLFIEPATNIWLGYNHHFIIYPNGNSMYTFGATFPAVDNEAMSWTASATSDEAQAEFAGFDPIVSRILAKATSVKQWRLAEVPRLPRWTSTSGKVVLIGDAAHGMLQYLAQGAAMATEDAAALAECVGRIRSTVNIPTALRAFERSRKWRSEIVQANARRNGDLIHMPDGEEQEQRDIAMRGGSQTGLWRADTGPLMDQNLRSFLYGHDAISHTRQILDSLLW